MALLEEVLPAFREGKQIRLDGAAWIDPNSHRPAWATVPMNLSGLLSDKWEVKPDGKPGTMVDVTIKMPEDWFDHK